jgi:hypothetical protein
MNRTRANFWLLVIWLLVTLGSLPVALLPVAAQQAPATQEQQVSPSPQQAPAATSPTTQTLHVLAATSRGVQEQQALASPQAVPSAASGDFKISVGVDAVLVPVVVWDGQGRPSAISAKTIFRFLIAANRRESPAS